MERSAGPAWFERASQEVKAGNSACSAPGAREAVELIAVVVAVTDGQPRVLTVGGGATLPAGPFETAHRSLQLGVRAWVERQTHQPLGYVEQLYTFADGDREVAGEARRVISISYLGLARERHGGDMRGAQWCDCYRYFPWEDRRRDRAAETLAAVTHALQGWIAAAADPVTRRRRRQRVRISFGSTAHPWNEELVLQRYELLYEAGLVDEASRRVADGHPPSPSPEDAASWQGQPMTLDHRRILATAMARLRSKIKYRPVVFELMADCFTLLQLQRAVEAIAGRPLHKQNFRRLIEQQKLVEPTGQTAAPHRGRPAQLFRFRRAVLAERAVIGTKLPLVRA
ncbi:MAG TPA: hypothetical protein VF265_06450 [Nevskiaceae bacterium]